MVSESSAASVISGSAEEVAFGGQQGDVQRRIDQHDLRQIGIAVVVVYGDGAVPFDHMVIRYEKIVVFQVETTAGAA